MLDFIKYPFTGRPATLLFLICPTIYFTFSNFPYFSLKNSYLFLLFPPFLFLINHVLCRECKNVPIFTVQLICYSSLPEALSKDQCFLLIFAQEA